MARGDQDTTDGPEEETKLLHWILSARINRHMDIDSHYPYKLQGECATKAIKLSGFTAWIDRLS